LGALGVGGEKRGGGGGGGAIKVRESDIKTSLWGRRLYTGLAWNMLKPRALAKASAGAKRGKGKGKCSDLDVLTGSTTY